MPRTPEVLAHAAQQRKASQRFSRAETAIVDITRVAAAGICSVNVC